MLAAVLEHLDLVGLAGVVGAIELGHRAAARDLQRRGARPPVLLRRERRSSLSRAGRAAGGSADPSFASRPRAGRPRPARPRQRARSGDDDEREQHGDQLHGHHGRAGRLENDETKSVDSHTPIPLGGMYLAAHASHQVHLTRSPLHPPLPRDGRGDAARHARARPAARDAASTRRRSKLLNMAVTMTVPMVAWMRYQRARLAARVGDERGDVRAHLRRHRPAVGRGRRGRARGDDDPAHRRCSRSCSSRCCCAAASTCELRSRAVRAARRPASRRRAARASGSAAGRRARSGRTARAAGP